MLTNIFTQDYPIFFTLIRLIILNNRMGKKRDGYKKDGNYRTNHEHVHELYYRIRCFNMLTIIQIINNLYSINFYKMGLKYLISIFILIG